MEIDEGEDRIDFGGGVDEAECRFVLRRPIPEVQQGKYTEIIEIANPLQIHPDVRKIIFFDGLFHPLDESRNRVPVHAAKKTDLQSAALAAVDLER